MRSIVGAVLALGLTAMAGSATAQSSDRTFVGAYSVHARGVDAGDFNFRFTQSGSSYTATATREMKGWVGAALGRSQDYRYSVSGSVASDGALRPRSYEHQGGRRRDDRPNGRLVRASFTSDDVTTTSVPAGMGMGDPPATAAQRRNVIDQITAIATMITASEDPCSRTLRIYMDGRSRFDFVIGASSEVNIDSAAYEGPGLRCRVQFRPIAGFGDPQEEATLTFLFAPTPSGMFAPIRIEMPTDGVGVVRLEADRLTVNGTRLR